ncbi:hypothetical protein PsYK624_075730 [Phanerochaete sordida]|uniref:Uncharacterized protein n=1 Tax=Phanerochaete sordida TaxID=48140 RepID=A0A9P3LEE5_9APHY|nr:hypothetical protein PsYK624_075730 [Phanerochaete sordida]
MPSPPIVEGRKACGKATVFDAEMIALNRGTAALFREWEAWYADPRNAALRASDDYEFTWNVFVDNVAAANAIFACRNGPSALQSVLASQRVKVFLDRHPRHYVRVFWVPSHVHSRAAAKDPAQPPFVSWAAARAAVTAAAAAEWQQLMKDQTYRGHSNLLKQAEHRLIVPSSRHHLLAKYGGNSRKYARITRFLTNHMPSGEFRAKFNREGPRDCLCTGVAETRSHILYECPYWVRPRSLPAPQAVPRARRIELEEAGKQLQLQAEEQRASLHHIEDFLTINPLVATFEWQDLMEHVRSVVYPARDAGDPAWRTPAYFFFVQMTTARRRWYREWRRARSKTAFPDWVLKHRHPSRLVTQAMQRAYPLRRDPVVFPDWLLPVLTAAGVPPVPEPARDGAASRSPTPDPPAPRRSRRGRRGALDLDTDSESDDDPEPLRGGSAHSLNGEPASPASASPRSAWSALHG